MNWRMRRRLRKSAAYWDNYWHIRYYANLVKQRPAQVASAPRPARIVLEWPRDPTLIRELRESLQKACSK